MKKFLFVLAMVLIFVFAVPIIINELYKTGTGYITMWGAPDVLSYYGAILGTASTIGALVATISFTRKQINRDAYIKNENEKWSKIEAVFADALNSINPMLPLIGTMDTGFTDPSAARTVIQKYQISCNVATDQLNTCLCITDYPKVKNLIDAINNFSEQISAICTEEIESYSKLYDLINRDTAKKTIDMEMQYPGSFPTETITSCSRIISDTDGIKYKDIEDTIGQLTTKMTEIYQSAYRSLLQLKGSTFEAIHTETQNKADSILCTWGKSNAHT